MSLILIFCGQCVDAADDEHGQVLERPARHLRHAKTCRRAHQVVAVQEAALDRGYVLHPLGAAPQTVREKRQEMIGHRGHTTRRSAGRSPDGNRAKVATTELWMRLVCSRILT